MFKHCPFKIKITQSPLTLKRASWHVNESSIFTIQQFLKMTINICANTGVQIWCANMMCLLHFYKQVLRKLFLGSHVIPPPPAPLPLCASSVSLDLNLSQRSLWIVVKGQCLNIFIFHFWTWHEQNCFVPKYVGV